MGVKPNQFCALLTFKWPPRSIGLVMVFIVFVAIFYGFLSLFCTKLPFLIDIIKLTGVAAAFAGKTGLLESVLYISCRWAAGGVGGKLVFLSKGPLGGRVFKYTDFNSGSTICCQENHYCFFSRVFEVFLYFVRSFQASTSTST